MNKYILALVLMLVCAVSYGQFSRDPRKPKLNVNTDSKGLIHYGSGKPTYRPNSRFDTYAYVDTSNNELYLYQDTFWYAVNTIIQEYTPQKDSVTANGNTIVNYSAVWFRPSDSTLYAYNMFSDAWVPLFGIYYSNSPPVNETRIEYETSFWNSGDTTYYHLNGSWYPLEPMLNIYNASDTLTGNRILYGDSRTLEFRGLASFKITDGPVGINQDPTSDYRLGVNGKGYFETGGYIQGGDDDSTQTFFVGTLDQTVATGTYPASTVSMFIAPTGDTEPGYDRRAFDGYIYVPVGEADSLGNLYGVVGSVVHSGQSPVDSIAGLYAYVEHDDGNQVLDFVTGIRGRVFGEYADTVRHEAVYYGNHVAKAGYFDNVYGLRLDMAILNPAVVNDRYAIYISDTVGLGATNDWSIYSDNPTPSYLSGQLYVGEDNNVDAGIQMLVTETVSANNYGLAGYFYTTDSRSASITSMTGVQADAVIVDGTVTSSIGGSFQSYGGATVGESYGTFSMSNVSSGTATWSAGAYNFGNPSGTAQVDSVAGAYNEVRVNNGADATMAYGTYSLVNIAATGTIDSAFGIYSNIALTVDGQINDGFGLYIADMPNGPTHFTNNSWGVYVAGDERSYFGGEVRLGDVTSGTAVSTLGIDADGDIVTTVGGGISDNIYTSSDTITDGLRYVYMQPFGSLYFSGLQEGYSSRYSSLTLSNGYGYWGTYADASSTNFYTYFGTELNDTTSARYTRFYLGTEDSRNGNAGGTSYIEINGVQNETSARLDLTLSNDNNVQNGILIDSTGVNIYANTTSDKYRLINSLPSYVSGDTSVMAWSGTGANATPIWLNKEDDLTWLKPELEAGNDVTINGTGDLVYFGTGVFAWSNALATSYMSFNPTTSGFSAGWVGPNTMGKGLIRSQQGSGGGPSFMIFKMGLGGSTTYGLTIDSTKVYLEGPLRFSTYPGSITGTPSKLLVVESDGDVLPVTLGTNLSFSGTTLNATGGGSFTSFTAAGDTGSNQTITDGNTLTLAGGWGVNTSGAATDIINIVGDSTQVATQYDILQTTQGWVNGTGTAPRIPYWSDSNTLTDEAAFTYTAASNRINVGVGEADFTLYLDNSNVEIQSNSTTDDAQLTVSDLTFIIDEGGGGTYGGRSFSLGSFEMGRSNIGVYDDEHYPELSFVRRQDANEDLVAEVVTNNSILGMLSFRGSRASNTDSTSSSIRAVATENWSGTASGSKLIFSTTDNTTTTLDDRLIIEQNDSITANTSVKIVRPGITADREHYLTFKTSDATNDMGGVGASSYRTGTGTPSFWGYSADSTNSPITIRALVPASRDASTGDPMIAFQAAETDDATDPNSGTFGTMNNRDLMVFYRDLVGGSGSVVFFVDQDGEFSFLPDLGLEEANATIDITGSLLIRPQSSPPTGTEGEFYFDDDTNTPWFHNGSTWVEIGTGGSGESNTASNVGSGTGLVFKQKTGVDLEFKSLLEGTGISITNNASDITLTAAPPINTLTAATNTNTINNTNYTQTWQWNTLSGAALNLSTTSTAAAGNAQALLKIDVSGANATSSQTTYGIQLSNTHTGTSAANIGIKATATGGSASSKALWGVTTNGKAVVGDASTTGTGVEGTSTSGTGVSGSTQGTAGYGVLGTSTAAGLSGGYFIGDGDGGTFYGGLNSETYGGSANASNAIAANFTKNSLAADSTLAKTVAKITNQLLGGSSNTVDVGFGGSLDFQFENTDAVSNELQVAARILAKWLDPTKDSEDGQLEFWTQDDGAAATRKVAISDIGKVTFDTYGVGTHTGTAAKWLAVTSAGIIIEENAPTGGTTDLTFTGASSPYTLNSSSGTDVTFAEGTGITLSRSTNELTVAVNRAATGIYGGDGSLTTDVDITGAGFDLQATGLDVTTFGFTGEFALDYSSSATNTQPAVLALSHMTSGTAATNFGASITYELENASGTAKAAGLEGLLWSDATNASEDADFQIKLMTAGAAAAQKLLLKSTGEFNLNAYGTRTFTGTEAYSIGVTSAGKIIETYPKGVVPNSTETVYTSTQTATKGEILLMDCSAAVRTVNPPSSPVIGERFGVSDAKASSSTYNITIDFTTASQKLYGSIQNYVMNTDGAYVEFIYVGSTTGWIATK